MCGIRLMKECEIAQIARLEREIFTDAWTKQGIEDTYRQPQTLVIVAEENGAVQGYCIVYYVLDEAEIARIAVSEKRRGRGTGGRILEKTEECCRKKGVERLLLDVREGNGTARKFYQKHGFREDGIRKNFYAAPVEHAVLMSKTLV